VPVPPAPSLWSNPATYLHILATALTVLFSSGVLPATSEASRIAVIVALVLGQLGYPVVMSVANSAAARNTEIRARAARVAAGVVTTATAFVIVMLIGSAAIAVQGCGAAQTFGTCSISVLESDVGNGTLASAVDDALDKDDYAGAIATLISKVGAQEVGCGVIAVSDVNANTGSGSAAPGSGATPAAVDARSALLAQRKARADILIGQYGWRGKK